jgi:hypothetical protein
MRFMKKLSPGYALPGREPASVRHDAVGPRRFIRMDKLLSERILHFNSHYGGGLYKEVLQTSPCLISYTN